MTFTFKTAHNTFASWQPGDKARLEVNRPSPGIWEQMTLVTIRPGVYALKTHHGFLSAQPDGTWEYRESVGPWEELRIIQDPRQDPQ